MRRRRRTPDGAAPACGQPGPWRRRPGPRAGPRQQPVSRPAGPTTTGSPGGDSEPVVVASSPSGTVASYQPQIAACTGITRIVLNLRVQAARRLELLKATAAAKATSLDLTSPQRSVLITDPHNEGAPTPPAGRVAAPKAPLWIRPSTCCPSAGSARPATPTSTDWRSATAARSTFAEPPAGGLRPDRLRRQADRTPDGQDGLPCRTRRRGRPIRQSPIRQSPIRHSPVDDSGPDTSRDAAENPTVAAGGPQGVPLLDKRIRAASTGRGTGRRGPPPADRAR